MKKSSNMGQLTNKWVLITGASSGLGYEMALQLAKQENANLILAARREEKLEQLKAAITQQSSVVVKTIKADLTQEEDIDKVIYFCLQQKGFYGAILNAGLTYLGKHTDIDLAYMNKILQLNIVSTTNMLTRLAQHFEDHQLEGRIMVVSSMGASYPLPYQSLYAGTKAFLSNFTNGIYHELTNKKLGLSVYSPNGIKTEMTDTDKLKKMEKWLVPVDAAAASGIHCFMNNSYNHIPGFGNKMMSIFSRFVPKKILGNMIGKQYANSINAAKKG